MDAERTFFCGLAHNKYSNQKFLTTQSQSEESVVEETQQEIAPLVCKENSRTIITIDYQFVFCDFFAFSSFWHADLAAF